MSRSIISRSDCRSAFRSIPAEAKYEAPWSGPTASVRWRCGSIARPPWAEPSSTQRAPILAAAVGNSGKSAASGGSTPAAAASNAPISASKAACGRRVRSLLAQPLLHRRHEAVQGTDRAEIPFGGRLAGRQRAEDRVQVKPLVDRPRGDPQALGNVFDGKISGHGINHG